MYMYVYMYMCTYMLCRWCTGPHSRRPTALRSVCMHASIVLPTYMVPMHSLQSLLVHLTALVHDCGLVHLYAEEGSALPADIQVCACTYV